MAESSSKIQKIFDSIVDLSIMEVVDLVKKMEDELGVSAAQAVAVAAPIAGAGAEAAAEKTEFDVILKSFGDNQSWLKRSKSFSGRCACTSQRSGFQSGC